MVSLKKLIFFVFFSVILFGYSAFSKNIHSVAAQPEYYTVEAEIYEKGEMVGAANFIVGNHKVGSFLMDQGAGRWVMQIGVDQQGDLVATKGRVCKFYNPNELYEIGLSDILCLNNFNFASLQVVEKDIEIESMGGGLKLKMSVSSGPKTSVFLKPYRDFSK